MKKVMLASSTLFLIVTIIITLNLNKKNNNFENGEIKIFCWGQYKETELKTLFLF